MTDQTTIFALTEQGFTLPSGVPTQYINITGSLFNHTSIAYVEAYATATSFARAVFVLLLRAGYTLIQVGCIPTEDVYLIILQNIVDISITLTSFCVIGYILAFGNATPHIFGRSQWIASSTADLDDAIYGFSAALIGTAIITTFLAGRLHFVSYILVSFLYAGIFQPLVMHWTWVGTSLMRHQHLGSYDVSVKDNAGGITVHITASIVGLIGSMFLGRRILRLRDIDDCSIGTDSVGTTIVGYLFVLLGLIAFSNPLPEYVAMHRPSNFAATVMVNNVMAMGGGMITVVLLHLAFYYNYFSYWVILKCMQGSLVGIVCVSSGVDVYNPMVAFLLSIVSAVLYYSVSELMHRSSIEDYCNVVAIHLSCGLVAAVSPALMGKKDNLGYSVPIVTSLVHLMWQVICLLSIICLIVLVFSLVFLVLNATGFLRNKKEAINHRRGLNAHRNARKPSMLTRTFKVTRGTPFLEPGAAGKSANPVRKFMTQDLDHVHPHMSTAHLPRP